MPDTTLAPTSDEEAIRSLVSRYSHAVACLDPKAAAALFTEDGSLSIMDNCIVTRGAISSGMRDTFGHFAMLQLTCSNGLIDLRGDEARAIWSTTEWCVRKDSKTLDMIFGRYEDDMVREEGAWLFKKRVFTMATRLQLDAAKMQQNTEFAHDFPAPFWQRR